MIVYEVIEHNSHGDHREGLYGDLGAAFRGADRAMKNLERYDSAQQPWTRPLGETFPIQWTSKETYFCTRRVSLRQLDVE